MMSATFFRMAGGCPHYDSVRTVKGLEAGNVPSRDNLRRCNHCVHWRSGGCDLFLIRE